VRQSISLTGQFAAVDEILTGRENIIMIARLRHLSNPRQVADDLLQRFGLTDAADRGASTYSGGMRRRLDIAMSLVGKPQLIFLDEPTAGLDWSMRQQLIGLLAKLKAHWSLLVVSHDAGELVDIADQCWTLSHGELTAVQPDELKAGTRRSEVAL